MLGKLAKWLRILGFDTIYLSQIDVKHLFALGEKEGRIVLTRATKIGKRKGPVRVLLVEKNDPKMQLKEVIGKLNLTIGDADLCKRCLRCNQILKAIAKEKAEGEVPEYIFRTHKEFSFCPQCQKIFWPGTHHGNMVREIKGFGGEGILLNNEPTPKIFP